MKGYKHLTAHDRNKMAKMRKEGATMRQIGAALHVSAATVCRELKRGTYTYMNADYIEVTEYIPERSQKRYEANLEAKGPGLKIGNHRDYAEKLEELIVDYDYSPSAALHEIENHPEIYGEFGVRVCRQTLYSYVEKRIFARLTNKDLPFKGARQKKKTKHIRRMKSAAKGDSIEKRPEEVNTRQEPGHWEMDLVVSCKGGKSVLLTLTERMSRQEIIMKLPDRRAETIRRAIDRLERRTPDFQQKFKSVTTDNGSEFLQYDLLRKSCRRKGQRFDIYYCHSYSAWEKGCNENHNRMIRRFFPKGTNFDQITNRQIRRVQDWMNQYPRKSLAWKSPSEAA